MEKKAVKRRKTLTPDMAGSLVKSCETSPDGNEVRIVLNIDSYQLPTAQQKGAFVGKDNRVHFFTKAKIAKAQKTLILALSPVAYHCSQWGKTPISLSIEFCFPFPKTTSKKHLVNYTYHVQRPDLDNIYKDFGDAMTEAGFWDDDSQIAELVLRKFRVTENPRIVISVRKLSVGVKDQELF